MSPITFVPAVHGLFAPMPGDKTALGSAPTAAFQYCEAMATASAFGWYVFPPRDIQLRWTGFRVDVLDQGTWGPLEGLGLGEVDQATWDAHAPEPLKGHLPYYVQRLFVPGIVQIWSGFLVLSDPGWSILVRPLPNVFQNEGYGVYDGLVETDVFRPCPLFINIRMLKTDTVVTLPRDQPLFAVQPIRRESYAAQTLACETSDPAPGESGISSLTPSDRAALDRTIRLFDPLRGDSDFGGYKALIRRRRRSEKGESEIQEP